MQKGTIQLSFEAADDKDLDLFIKTVELFAQKVFQGASITQVVWPVNESQVSSS